MRNFTHFTAGAAFQTPGKTSSPRFPGAWPPRTPGSPLPTGAALFALLHSNLSNPFPGHHSALGGTARVPGTGAGRQPRRPRPRALPTGVRPAPGLGPLLGRRPQPGRPARVQLHPFATGIPHPHFGSLGQPSARCNKAGHVRLGERRRPGREGACAGAEVAPGRTKGAQREGSGPVLEGRRDAGPWLARPVVPAPRGPATRPLSPEAAPPRGRAPG